LPPENAAVSDECCSLLVAVRAVPVAASEREVVLDGGPGVRHQPIVLETVPAYVGGSAIGVLDSV
jgi:hypothetical protein